MGLMVESRMFPEYALGDTGENWIANVHVPEANRVTVLQ
jgi:hypothetical protein